MLNFIEVYEKWINETYISQESSDLFDADGLINDDGEIIPIFFFRFIWTNNKSYIHINLRGGRLQSNEDYQIDNSKQLEKYIQRCGLTNCTFHVHALASSLPNRWKEVLTISEISEIKIKREKKIEQLINDVVSNIRKNKPHLIN